MGFAAAAVCRRLGVRTIWLRGEVQRAIPWATVSGADCDGLPIVTKARDVLDALDVPCEVLALSAHRTPDRVVAYVGSARERGIEVIIACAGMAAHLAGVVAAHTTLPVIGVPLASGAMGGLDALLATVQMPPGIPVATVGVDGSRNAAFLAARVLSLSHPELVGRLEATMAEDRKRYDEPPTVTAAAPAAAAAPARAKPGAPKPGVTKARRSVAPRSGRR